VPFKFNPFTGNLDLVNTSSGGGGGYTPPTWTINSTTGSINNLAYATGAFKFTGASATPTGVVAQADGTELVVYNAHASQVLTISHESGLSTAANRFTGGGTGNNLIRPGHGSRYKYDSATSRWILVVPNSISVSSPIALTNANNISISTASTSSNGSLAAADWNTFNGKIGGAGTSGQIAYFSGSTTIASENQFSWNAPLNRLGVQVGVSSEEAVGHLKSVTTISLTNPTTFTATLVEFNPIDEPSGSSAPTQVPGRLMNPNSPSAVEDASGATSYNIGDTLEYRISPYYDDGAANFTECAAYTLTATVTMAGNNNGVDISWTPDTSGTLTIAGYNIYRNYNGGGFLDYADVGNVTSINDDSAFWVGGGYPAYSQFSDYVAIGTSRDYHYYSRAIIAPGTYYSALFETSLTG
jgi:hypothetical protein